MIEIVNDALDQSNQNVNKGLVESFQRRRDVHARQINYSLKDLETSRELAIVS